MKSIFIFNLCNILGVFNFVYRQNQQRRNLKEWWSKICDEMLVKVSVCCYHNNIKDIYKNLSEVVTAVGVHLRGCRNRMYIKHWLLLELKSWLFEFMNYCKILCVNVRCFKPLHILLPEVWTVFLYSLHVWPFIYVNL